MFPLLSGKDSDAESLIANCWAKVHSSNESLRFDLVHTFADIFIAVLNRITDNSYESEVKSKLQKDLSKQMDLKRKKSVLDEDTSTLLVDSATRVIFSTFNKLAK